MPIVDADAAGEGQHRQRRDFLADAEPAPSSGTEQRDRDSGRITHSTPDNVRNDSQQEVMMAPYTQ